MAFQKSLIKLEGQIDDLTFYKTKDGYAARRKTGVSADRVKTDPRFERTRENMAEFNRAGKATKLLRKTFRLELASIGDGKFVSRAVQLMMQIIKSDTVNDRGKKNILNGDVSLMQNLQFNGAVAFESSFLAPFTKRIDRATGTITVDVPAFIAANGITKPDGATHFRLIATAAELDFEGEQYVSKEAESSDRLIGPQQETIQLVCQLPAASTKTLVLAVGILFGQISNGKYYSLKNAGHNAMAVILVDKGTA